MIALNLIKPKLKKEKHLNGRHKTYTKVCHLKMRFNFTFQLTFFKGEKSQNKLITLSKSGIVNFGTSDSSFILFQQLFFCGKNKILAQHLKSKQNLKLFLCKI
jgi:hypothetical protein